MHSRMVSRDSVLDNFPFNCFFYKTFKTSRNFLYVFQIGWKKYNNVFNRHVVNETMKMK